MMKCNINKYLFTLEYFVSKIAHAGLPKLLTRIFVSVCGSFSTLLIYIASNGMVIDEGCIWNDSGGCGRGLIEKLKSIIFWDMTPCSPLHVSRRFGGTYRLHLQGRRNKFSKKPACHLLARWFAEPVSSTLKMEAICSSETSVETQRTTRRHIPEDDTLHYHRCENLKS
jgi:hypothetical protein